MMIDIIHHIEKSITTIIEIVIGIMAIMNINEIDIDETIIVTEEEMIPIEVIVEIMQKLEIVSQIRNQIPKEIG